MSNEVAQRLEETLNKNEKTIGQEPSPDPIYDLKSSVKTEIERLVYKSFEIGKIKRWQENQALHYGAASTNCGGRFSKFSEGPPYRKMSLNDALEEEQRFFSSVSDYTFKIDDLRVDVFGNTAIATFIVEQTGKIIATTSDDNSAKEEDNAIIERKIDDKYYDHDTLNIKSRGSMVFLNFSNTEEEQPTPWLIAHEHFSRVANESNH